MANCSLCRTPNPVDVTRVSGLDLCGDCRNNDPKEPLKTHHGIEVEWDTRMLRFNAGMGIPEQDPEFSFKCVPERWPHWFTKRIWPDVDIGDADFDHRIYTQTSDVEKVTKLLSNEGMQSAVLAFLSSVRDNELMTHHVSLKGPTLTIAVRCQGTYDDERVQEFKIEAGVIALHLRYPA